MSQDSITRRTFVTHAAKGAAALSVAHAVTPARGAAGANERVRLGFIGVGGRGTDHLKRFAGMQDVSIVAVCDVDTSHREAAAKLAGSSPKVFNDFRELLDMKDIDGVVIATPGHWHAIPAMQACQAGKHVYIEKPAGHTVHEGRVLADRAAKCGRVVLHGTQQRSDRHWIHAVERIRAGELGRISLVHAWNAWGTKEMGGTLQDAEDCDPPAGLDYEMWLGPAPRRRFNPTRLHFNFYFFWDYSGGMVSAWGIHLFDVVAWAMGPGIKSVAAVGGNFVHKDKRETPDTADAVFDCPGYTLTYSMRHGNSWRPHGDMDHGIEFFGTDGTLQINRNGFQIYREWDRSTRKPFYSEEAEKGPQSYSCYRHNRHFLDCIRGQAKPNCDAETAHLSCLFGHLANIAYRSGRKVDWDGASQTIPNAPDAAKLLTKEYREPWKLQPRSTSTR